MSVKHLQIAALIVVFLGQSEPAATSTLADPTRPGYPAIHPSQKRSGAVPGSWVLNSTLVSRDRRVAVINGRHVSEGESVDNATVLQIRKLGVDIQVSGKHITLPLLPDIVKRQP